MEKKLEKRRKGIETVFDILFFLILFNTIGIICWEFLYVFNIASSDLISYTDIILSIINTILIFICTRLAHKGFKSAGFFGIITAILLMFTSGIIIIILSILLLVDSIIYLIKYKKEENNLENKKQEKKLILTFVVLCIISGIVIIVSNSFSESKYMVPAGETLIVDEETAKFKVTILSDIEQYEVTDSIIDNGQYIRVKVRVENLHKKNSLFLFETFDLINENKNVLYPEQLITCNYYNEKCLNDEILANSQDEGYLYFYNSRDKINNKYITDYTQIKNIKYLKIAVLDEYKNNEKITKDYYLEIK